MSMPFFFFFPGSLSPTLLKIENACSAIQNTVLILITRYSAPELFYHMPLKTSFECRFINLRVGSFYSINQHGI